MYHKYSQIQTSHAESFLNKISLQGNENILDIGCGDGRITNLIAQQLPTGTIKGIDISSTMIKAAHETFPQLTFEVADALTYQDDQRYDIITCLSTLHWFIDQQAIFNKMKSLLKPNGKIHILTYSPVDAYWKPMEEVIYSKQWQSFFSSDPFYYQPPKDILKKEISQAGLSIESFQEIPDVATFHGAQGYINHISGFLPHLNQLPKNFHDKFLYNIKERFLAWNQVDKDGVIRIPYEAYEIILSAQQPH